MINSLSVDLCRCTMHAANWRILVGIVDQRMSVRYSANALFQSIVFEYEMSTCGRDFKNSQLCERGVSDTCDIIIIIIIKCIIMIIIIIIITIITRNFNVKVSAGEGKAFIGVVETYTENNLV